MIRTRRLFALVAYAAMGPITGPCVAGVVRNLRKGAPVLAGLYIAAGVALWVDLALLSRWSASVLMR